MNAVRLVIEAAAGDARAGAYARTIAVDERGEQLGPPLDFSFALAPEDRELLRWAAIEYTAWPFGGHRQRAQRARERAVAVGSALYRAAILTVTNLRPTRVIVQTTLVDALRLPWELLHDGVDFIALADPPCAIVRTSIGASADAANIPTARRRSAGEAPLRVLLVTARPIDAPAVDVRLVAQKLFVRLEARVRDGTMALEYLRPPTFDALVARLHAQPAVDIVHFDGHGSAGGDPSNAFAPALIFEDSHYKTMRLPADRYARALADGGVSASILTACETAVVTDAHVESAAAAIVDAGVAAVVAMGDEILVDSAAAYADAFYVSLARGAQIDTAHGAARSALASRAALGADWWTPQFYARGRAHSDAAMVPAAATAPVADVGGSPGGFGVTDCVGRASELLAIDRALTAGSHVVLRGLAGAGKTTLAREAARWLTLSRGCTNVREIGCGAIPGAVLDALEGVADSGAAPEGEPRPLVIIDGLESLDGPVDAATLGTALERIARTSMLLVTTRDLRDGTPATGELLPWTFVNVGSLAANEGLELARRVISSSGPAPGILDRDAREAAIASVGGLPFGITAQLAPGVPQGDAAFAAWAPYVESSLGRLAPAHRALVTALRELVRGGNFFIARTLTGLEREPFAAFVEELRHVGLGDSAPLTDLPEGKMLCLKLHPALMPFERLRTGSDRALVLRFAQAYDDLSATLAVPATSSPSLPSKLYAFERPNLERAAAAYDMLAMTAEASALRASLYALAGQFGGHLDDFAIGPNTFEGAEDALRAAHEALNVAETAPSPDPSEIANARVILGISLDRAGRTPESVEETERACAALSPLVQRQEQTRTQPRSNDVSVRANAAYLSALINLGGLQRKSGQMRDARATFALAQPLADRFDNPAAMMVHMQLGDLALAATDFVTADNEYRRTLVLARNETAPARAEEAGALFGRAGVAYKCGNFSQAEQMTRDAISACASIGDVRRIASGYLQLGSMAAERGAADEADRWFDTLRGSAGYAASDARTRAFFDASIASDMGRLVSDRLGTDREVATATTVPAYSAAAKAFLARDPESQRRLSFSKELAQRVVAEHGNDADCAGVEFARGELKRIATIEGVTTPT